MNFPCFLRNQAEGLYLAVKLQPRASASEIQGAQGDELKIKVTAPPVDSAANEALVDLLAETLNCSRGAVQLVKGKTSRHKLVKLIGISAEIAAQKLSMK
jgi:uncharacterized protein (TIGR00251 family)